MSEDLRVEKRQEQVVLFMADGVIIEGMAFLSLYAMNHGGEQTVLDLLLEDSPFLPLKSQNGEFCLVRKGMISHLRCSIEEEVPACSEREVRINFLGNESLQGMIKTYLPKHSSRLSDYLNVVSEFFPLFSGDHAYLINRGLIRDIVLID
jgi:hypothetical protein